MANNCNILANQLAQRFLKGLILIVCIQLSTQLPVTNVRTKRDSLKTNEDLQAAISELQRESLLPKDNQFVFDFLKAVTGITKFPGGHIVTASAVNFPALIGHGLAMNVATISPCGIIPPDTHPRAAEILYCVSGEFQVGSFQENGARLIMNNITSGQATIFPQGAMHFLRNLQCTPAMFVAAFNSVDPGVLLIANSFFGDLPADIVGASLGGLNITTVNSMKNMLFQNPAFGIDRECQKRCHL